MLDSSNQFKPNNTDTISVTVCHWTTVLG